MKVRIVDNYNRDLHRKPVGAYMIDIGLGRFTGLVTTGYIFAMRNGTSRVMKITKLFFHQAFDGVGEASTQIFKLKTFNTATPSGGTAITLPAGATKQVSNMQNSTLLDARYADITGTSPLTVTNVVFDPSMRGFNLPRRNGAATPVDMMPWHEKVDGGQLLLPSEGIAIQILNTAVVGDVLTGCITWEEYLAQEYFKD